MFDCHLHITKGLEEYDLHLNGANIIFNDIGLYNRKKEEYSSYYHSLIFDANRNLDWYRKLIDDDKIVCLKIHNRLQKIRPSGYGELLNKLNELNRNIPIIYDAFYYGANLDCQPNLAFLIKMIQNFPKRKFIIAHAGGYKILEYFFHLRDFENVGYDLSFSLQYLSDSSCRTDLKKLIKYTNPELLFYGSDYPKASPDKQLNILYEICDELELGSSTFNGICKNNWLKFLGLH